MILEAFELVLFIVNMLSFRVDFDISSLAIFALANKFL